jgi:uracil-DNA glycosylase family 4
MSISKKKLLDALYEQFPSCKSLPIDSQGATNIVYGEGDPNAEIMLIGEAPGQKEDELGRPFVGRSGQLLTKTLQEAGLSRNDVFITNVVKCRPPNNRTPTALEVAVYKKFLLLPEIKIIQPKLIITLGSIALKALLDDITLSITKARGKLYKRNDILIMPTYHPAYILRNPEELKTFKHDIEFAVSYLFKHKTTK